MKKTLWIVLFMAILPAAGIILVAGCGGKPKAVNESRQEQLYTCPMHPTYISKKPGDCPICGMRLVPVKSATNEQSSDDGGSAVHIDPAMVQNMGVQTEKAALRPLSHEIRTSGTVQVDERRVSVVSSRVMGYVEKLLVNYTGKNVVKDQPLLEIYSPDLVSAQNDYLQALKGAASTGDNSLVEGARQRLTNWGIPADQIAAIEAGGSPRRTLTLTSPSNGIVSEKMVVEGQSIDPGMKLFTITDFSRVWLVADIYQQDIAMVHIGGRAEVTLDGYPGERFSGTVSYVAPALNAESRTLDVRLDLVNTPDRKLKPGMNATVVFTAAQQKPVVTIPDQAVIRSGLRTIVVVAKGGGYFEPREVTMGQSANGYTEIKSGIAEGDEIVISSQFLIDSESNLKAAIHKLGGIKSSPDTNDKKIDMSDMTGGNMKQAAKPVYTCPMDPEVISDHPGKCPKCGMDLVLKKE